VALVPFRLIVYTCDRLTKETKPGIQGLFHFFLYNLYPKKNIHSSKYLDSYPQDGRKKHEGLQVPSVVVVFAFNKNWGTFWQILEKPEVSIFVKICSSVLQLFPAYRRKPPF